MITRLFFLITLIVGTASGVSGQTVLNQYIQQGLENNIALQRQNLSYERSLAALKEAKANFYPQLSIEARYSVARGGRAFEIPAGDLVNPAYQNLNVINQLGQSTSPDYPVFPTYSTVPNEEINFLRETEQETRLRVAMPVFNQAIIANQKIRTQLSEIEKIGVAVYKLELVKEIKQAYYNYQKASEALTLYNRTLRLVEENLRTTNSLFKNHQVTKDAVYLAEAQVREVEQELAGVMKQKQVAQAFFNFLLNQNYDAPIENETPENTLASLGTLGAAQNLAQQNRLELNQLDFAMSASEQEIQMARGTYLPTVNLVADYGIQGTEYSFTSEDDFFLGSLVMTWKLFQPANKAKVEQARLGKVDLYQQKQELRRQIDLQVVQAWYAVEAARKQESQAAAGAIAAGEAFKLINKKYLQGQVNMITFREAQTQMTNAQNQQIIAQFDYWIAVADLERVTATYRFNK